MSLEALRDEFAAAALIGLLSGRGDPDEFDAAGAAAIAYRYADAFLYQRRAYCPVCAQKIDPEKGFIVHESGCTYGWQEGVPTGVEL